MKEKTKVILLFIILTPAYILTLVGAGWLLYKSRIWEALFGMAIFASAIGMVIFIGILGFGFLWLLSKTRLWQWLYKRYLINWEDK